MIDDEIDDADFDQLVHDITESNITKIDEWLDANPAHTEDELRCYLQSMNK